MNRNYRVERYREIVRELREAAPDIAISSDFIVGFPTESAEDFEATLEMVREIRFNHAYCFKYSRRPNTAALELFQAQDEIDESVKRERLGQLIALQDTVALEINQELVGKEVEVLVEGPGKHISSAKGRTPQNTLVIVEGLEPAAFDSANGYSAALAGELLRVQIEQATAHTLRGRAVSQ
jgi:tRNA-2-methylthio-N6-dimethylallyladenosine synthase